MPLIAGFMVAIVLLVTIGAGVMMFYTPTKARGGWQNG
jgi:hypothetical protein